YREQTPRAMAPNSAPFGRPPQSGVGCGRANAARVRSHPAARITLTHYSVTRPGASRPDPAAVGAATSIRKVDPLGWKTVEGWCLLTMRASGNVTRIVAR